MKKIKRYKPIFESSGVNLYSVDSFRAGSYPELEKVFPDMKALEKFAKARHWQMTYDSKDYEKYNADAVYTDGRVKYFVKVN